MSERIGRPDKERIRRPPRDRIIGDRIVIKQVPRFSDSAQANIYHQMHSGAGDNISHDKVSISIENVDSNNQQIIVDREVESLLKWLAKEQGLTPEMALKKAVITAAYIYEITANEQGKLLIQKQDKTIREIDLKQ